MDKINKFIVFAVLSFATLASHIQASQNHKVNTFVLNWLHVCHQANKGSTSFLDTQNQESCLIAGGSFEESSDESSDTFRKKRPFDALYELLDVQVGQDSEKDDSPLVLDDPKNFVAFIQNPELWEELLKNTAWADNQRICTQEHCQILDEKLKEYMRKNTPSINKIQKKMNTRASALNECQSSEDDEEQDKITQIVMYGQSLLGIFKRNLESLQQKK